MSITPREIDIQQQVELWMQELTVSEKCSLLSGSGFWHSQNVDRLNIPKLMLTDGPHGLRKQGEKEDHLGQNESVPATCFPSEAGLAASWSRELAYAQGRAIGVECRAENVNVILGPGLNIKRSPLCGRNFEYLSEDPYLSSHIGAAYIQGAQSVGVGTSAKHFACNNQETKRLTINAKIDQRTLNEIYLASFETAVKEANPYTIMCAYNQVNGEYGAESQFLLNEVLRKQWNWDGVVVTDWGATNSRIKGLLASMDLEMPSCGGVNDKKVEAALEGNAELMLALDESVRRILMLILRTTYNLPEVEGFDAQRHHEIAREIAHESMVLLKNEQQVLPLKVSDSIAVLGEFAQTPRYQGGGSSHTNPTKVTSTWDSMQQYSQSLEFMQGFGIYDEKCDAAKLEQAKALAASKDKVVICGGLPERYETEGIDRTHLSLPKAQLEFIAEITKVNPNVVVVLNNGAPVEMPFANEVKAILEAYLPGQAGGDAIADVLFGVVSPSGKLAETFPLKLEHTSSYEYFPGEGYEVTYREGIYVGYRFFETKKLPVLFPFGHGLSYSHFKYHNLRLSQRHIRDDQTLQVSVDVTNSGDIDAKEVVQLYISDHQSEVLRPEIELKGFEKLSLRAGETQTAHFVLDKRSFAFFDEKLADWRVQSGQFDIRIGASCQDIRLTETVSVESTTKIPFIVHPNTTFGELRAHPATKAYADELIEYFIEHSGIDFNLGDNDENFAETVISFFPIKNMVLFCKSKFTESELEQALDTLTMQVADFEEVV
ncbi:MULTISPECIES: beta-glucosidase [Vibrio]|uniref:beta-glucosidase n=1 Tax=Vibrio TaxID=662 RepID=UPI0020763B75|nr:MULTISPECIES: glycoside hydrolase family 3 C-terminal domain-containing protein [Vibrio]USD35070.1 glycoside hydrolase family 3 C-terminal domain-containing protein [Vibrio sp. SCSIO 43186]USD48136.1 glycoside hydrolase family 3 C-terminal domain-containing protein [Vibrio sp. SCSIO 43145]USD72195.1 glycoside hydrolase family 3 C-terminal domain-containing protein [Vibrio sp. SCSIO 43139]USD97868.1 glycosyl hydrolase [Vibrio coralliilyticus]